MRRQVVLDFETASACNLKQAGAARYAEDPTTEIICLMWDDLTTARKGGWMPNSGQRDYALLRALAQDPEALFIAHNAGFEKAIWRKMMVPIYGFPDVPDERWHDTMAVCAMKGLPQKLERVLPILGLGNKDTVGSKHTINLSRTNKAGYYDRSQATLQRTYDYCGDDVAKERDLHMRVGWLSSDERKVWLLDQTINQRGVRLDLDFVRQAQTVVDRATVPLAKEFVDLTGVTFTQVAKFKAWLASQGTTLPDLQKATVAKVLGYSVDEEDDDGLTDDDIANVVQLTDSSRRALHIRQLVGSASVKKLPAMQRCVCADGKAYGLLQYHGAGTGRWAGRLLQPQNFPRGTLKDVDPETAVQTIMSGDPEYVAALLGPPVEAVLSSLRHAIVPSPHKQLAVGDFAGIEARIVLALAGQHDKTALMASGQDVYCDVASLIFGRQITKADVFERTIGKCTVLGCGFGMGWKKFQLRYAAHMDEAFCRGVIGTYRKMWAPKVETLWYSLNDACVAVVQSGRPHEAYGVEFRLENEWLTARLPSGRKLWYFGPSIRQEPMPWDEDDLRWVVSYSAWKTGQWKRVRSYGGLLTENVVQALARDLMVHAMFRCEEENMPVILTIHDEIVCEPKATRSDVAVVLKQIMEDRPQWAKNILVPVAAETWQGDRYRKG